MASLLDMAQARLQGLLDIPTRATRALVNPTLFSGLLGAPTLPQQQGFAESFAQLPQQPNMSVLDPMQAAYMQGYSVGEPYGLLASIAPFTKGMPVGASIKDVSKMSPYVPGVRAGEEMIVTHNLTPEKLYGAQKLGGLPVPSLAISKTESPLENFGEITLVGGKEMAIPSRENPVFRSDAYTKRRPGIVYDFDNKSQKNLESMFSEFKDLPRYDRDIYNLVDDFGRRGENRLLEAKFLKEKGILPDKKLYKDDYQFSADINALRRQNQSEYDNWLMQFDQNLQNEGVNVREKLFKGFTPSGNRKYVDATLDNIVKEMKGGASSEGWNYGVGNLRALATPKFKKFDDILKDREKIVSDESFDVIKDQTDKVYYDLLDRLKGINKNYSAEDAILEVVETRNVNSLDRIYENVPKELKADVGIFVKNLQKMPTEYFEIKPQRAVGLGEFKGAIVPEDTAQRTLSLLDEAGIKEVYKYSTPQERVGLIQRFGKEMFVGVPAIPAAGLLGGEEQ